MSATGKIDLRDVSRATSHALRHEPWLYELELDGEGWVATDALLAALHGERRAWSSITEASMRRIVRQLLASNGIRDVLEASDGAEALEQLQKPEHAGVDLVICDLMMPVMDGLTFCNQMRRDIRLKSRHVPISC